MLETLFENADKLDNIWLIWFMVWTVIFQWWLVVHLYKENKKENWNLSWINNEVLKELSILSVLMKEIAESNAKTNERIDYLFIKK